jgi:signal transduction histidine kinase
VLWNLISNASDAAGHGGTIDLDAVLADDGRSVAIAVTDDGPGIAEMAHIFEPFYTTKPRGTGLGLAVASRIVRDHGGVLTAENVEGRGARLRFRVPTVTAESVTETA